MKILEIIVSPLVALIVGIFFLGLFRKMMARIQWRYGPPLIQPVIDLVRLFNQRGFSHGAVFDLGIILSLAGALVLVLFIPIGGMCPLANSGGLLVILYVMLFAPIGIALSGGEGANPNISIGISRKLILTLSYEVPFIFIILSLMSYYQTISIVEIVKAQAHYHWSLFSPLFLSGVAYFMILPAMLGIRPFDMASAPQEISSGIDVEYGGKYLAFSQIEHALSLFIVIALFVNLFLGGGNLPVFLLKMLAVFVCGVFIHASFPRFRIEQATKYLWFWPTIISFISLIVIQLIR
ncbi:NADH-quinone oxidoreductase subunit H [Candidatus Sumerlaeota bacterium]|nr:NADH-quinone oxidoreductase subunit H [Candidatus Sumerlaeota bacterium]